MENLLFKEPLAKVYLAARHPISDAQVISKGCVRCLCASYPRFEIGCAPKEVVAQRVATDEQHLSAAAGEYVPTGTHIVGRG